MDRRSFCQQIVASGIVAGSLVTQVFAETPAPGHASTGPAVKWQKSLKTAQKLAVQQNKPIMIVFGASWCTYCHKLERETLAEKRTAAMIDREFIPVHLDFNKEEKVAKILEVERLPCVVILTPDADLLMKYEGFAAPKEFQATMTAALEKRAEIQQVRSETPVRR